MIRADNVKRRIVAKSSAVYTLGQLDRLQPTRTGSAPDTSLEATDGVAAGQHDRTVPVAMSSHRRRRASVIGLIDEAPESETASAHSSSSRCAARWRATSEARKHDAALRRRQITAARKSGMLQLADLVVRPAVVLDVLKRHEDKRTGLVLLFSFLLYFFAFIACTNIFLTGTACTKHHDQTADVISGLYYF